MSGPERTDGAGREVTAGEGLFDATDGAVHWPMERTEGRAREQGVAPPRTLVLARVAAPRRGMDGTTVDTPRAVAILQRVREEPCDVLPLPDDGIPVQRPRAVYAAPGAARDADEVTSEVRRVPFTVSSVSMTAVQETLPARRGWGADWLRRLLRWWRRET